MILIFFIYLIDYSSIVFSALICEKQKNRGTIMIPLFYFIAVALEICFMIPCALLQTQLASALSHA